jgi:hypothetical protein
MKAIVIAALLVLCFVTVIPGILLITDATDCWEASTLKGMLDAMES